ncbi:MAG: Signal-transduction protein [Candidatus Uhrbacteria bacterium GW2011_GWD2_52_7]|uniref:Signal-transduction protein n=1 Tax=Candidatus Uhrbacteria bacterium GW2011_GWD2_52_7 TaxID=1618989 RepID=A0A0G1ZNC5_9BACT|nr:MAG: Signal-transduction protein [Candidatus Uhrbacteria bacterium GW2011_GWD2_52_7]
MLVGDVMTRHFVTVAPTCSWREAAALLMREHLSSAFVVDEHERLVGIISEKDLFRGIYPSYKDWTSSPHAFHDFQEMEQEAMRAEGKSVADVMSARVITAELDTPILKVGALMVASGIHHVPVIEQGKVIGTVGRGDIYRAILKQYYQM